MIWCNDVTDDLQGAGQEKCSSMHTTWLLRETISANREKGCSVYVGLLDTKKAFDSVWINGLMYKLFKLGMDGKMWRILRDMYKEFHCCVQIDGTNSAWFTIEQGLHQGAPWSMYGYQVMINDLIIALKCSGLGIVIKHINTSSPTFAEDMAIVAIYKKCLQHLFNIANKYCRMWRYQFNVGKSAVLVFGKDEDPTRTIHMGPDPVVVEKSSMHMGVTLTHSNLEEEEFVRDRCSSGMRCYYSVKGVGSKKIPLTPEAASKLYWAISVPKVAYGVEALQLSSKSLRKMEQTHSAVAKQIQGLPTRTANAGCLATLGWLSLGSYTDIIRMLFIWRILLLPASNIYRRVLLVRLCQHLYVPDGCHHGPTQWAIIVFKKYGILQVLLSAIETGDILPLSLFKKSINELVKQYESNVFIATCMMYPKLSIFQQCTSSIVMWPWWQLASARPDLTNKCRLLVKVMFRETCLNGDTYKFKFTCSRDSHCTQCDSHCKETAEHVLFTCTAYDGLREDFWSALQMVAPQTMYKEFFALTPEKKLVFILNCMNGAPVMEWIPVYTTFLDYIASIWKHRKIITEM